MDKGVKMLLIACNTVSASAKKEIEEQAGNIPVIDVITAGAKVAASNPKHQNIGVIGTLATVNSGAYERAIHALHASSSIIQKACPLLVPLAEEGWIDNNVARQTLQEYLSHFDGSVIDSLILGCTHYPLFKDVIAEQLNHRGVTIIDSADSIADAANETLAKLNLQNDAGGSLDCYVSDRPQRFQELAERFLGRAISNIHIVDL